MSTPTTPSANPIHALSRFNPRNTPSCLNHLGLDHLISTPVSQNDLIHTVRDLKRRLVQTTNDLNHASQVGLALTRQNNLLLHNRVNTPPPSITSPYLINTPIQPSTSTIHEHIHNLKLQLQLADQEIVQLRHHISSSQLTPTECFPANLIVNDELKNLTQTIAQQDTQLLDLHAKNCSLESKTKVLNDQVVLLRSHLDIFQAASTSCGHENPFLHSSDQHTYAQLESVTFERDRLLKTIESQRIDIKKYVHRIEVLECHADELITLRADLDSANAYIADLHGRLNTLQQSPLLPSSQPEIAIHPLNPELQKSILSEIDRDRSTLEHEYSLLQDKYDQTVRHYKHQIQFLQQQISNMQCDSVLDKVSAEYVTKLECDLNKYMTENRLLLESRNQPTFDSHLPFSSEAVNCTDQSSDRMTPTLNDQCSDTLNNQQYQQILKLQRQLRTEQILRSDTRLKLSDMERSNHQLQVQIHRLKMTILQLQTITCADSEFGVPVCHHESKSPLSESDYAPTVSTNRVNQPVLAHNDYSAIRSSGSKPCSFMPQSFLNQTPKHSPFTNSTPSPFLSPGSIPEMARSPLVNTHCCTLPNTPPNLATNKSNNAQFPHDHHVDEGASGECTSQ